MEQIERITYMEQILDEVHTAVASGSRGGAKRQ